MFGSTNPFGQSSNSPFGTPSVFGQTSSTPTNPFAPKPFGGTSPFGSQTGGSIFGGTSTGVFGSTQPSSPLGSTPAFGASTTPAFGSSIPSFGASSTPAFGASSSSFGTSSVFGQKPSFGGFGSTPTQTNPFGSGFQQTQPAFGSNLFGSNSPFGASSQPVFGASSTPAFGASSTPAFGTTSTPAFGAISTPAFGSTVTPTFGSTGTAFGVSSTPAFGSSAFGASSTPLFGSSTTPAFGATSTPSFGATSTPAFGASSTPSFSFGSTPSFGQSASTFGSTPFGTTPSPFGAQSPPFGSQPTTPTFGSSGFGQPAFGGLRGGSRVTPYTPTPEVDGGTSTQPGGKLESISAMPAYKDKSHEELRWEDYQQGDKGGPNPASQPAGGVNFSTSAQSSPFGTSAFGQTAPNLFSSSTSSNLFGQKTSTFGSGFGASTTPSFSSPFGSSTTSPFGTISANTAPSLFGPTSSSAFGGNTSSPFVVSTTPAFGSSSSFVFGSSSAGTTPAFGSTLTFGNTQSSGLFQSSTPSLGQTLSPFGQTPSFGQSSPFGQSNIFNNPSTGFGGGLFSSSSSSPSMLSSSPALGFGQTTPSLSFPFQAAAPGQTSSAFSFGNFGQTQSASSGGFGGSLNPFGQGLLGQANANQGNIVVQPAPAVNPFGTLPAMPHISFGRSGSSPSVQYGISSMPIAEKPVPTRISSLLTSRHLSQRKIRLPARKYHPKSDESRVPFFADENETPSTPKADALFVPRENPRALVIRPMDQWASTLSSAKRAPQKETLNLNTESGARTGKASAPATNGSIDGNHQEDTAEDGYDHRPNDSPLQPNSNQKANGFHGDNMQRGDSYVSLSGHRAGEAAIVYEHGADIEALMPKLRHADYYTIPRIQELAAKERAEPGFCRRVKDFVVGRHGFGSITFMGETDVRCLDLQTIIQFNNREVIVYMDESKKPPVGQGLNKPAEVTLLNIRCIEKKTGQQYTEGPKIERYREILKKKTEKQGAEFVSFDPVKGEWKFKVTHFSSYLLCDVDWWASEE